MKYSINSKKAFSSSALYYCFVILLAFILISTFFYRNSALFYRKLLVLPFSLHLNEYDLYLKQGEEFRLFVYGINIRVSYSSTNFRVAGVNFNGRVRAHQTGKTFIIAKVNGKQLKCRVHVIDLNTDHLELKVGDTYQLRMKGSGSFPSWSSKNRQIASVNLFGKVKARKRGSTVIYAKVKKKVIKCIVRVR